jgi:EAL domain-containing protein (putative c-di-GMP-specific phosphodiesterase class I)
VNLSPRQLAEDDFLDSVDDALRVSGLDAERLVLEVTESVLVEEGGTVVPVLSKLRQRGVKVAVDDFGTGYSSLGYLRRLPVDVLKIDRAFVTGVADSAEDAAVAQAVLSLARILGLATVAEGIETPEQAAALLAIGCTFGQGYLFSRPLPGPELETKLTALCPTG